MKLEAGRKEALRALLDRLRSEAKARRAEPIHGETKATQATESRAVEAEDYIALIDDALARVSRETYGFCDKCGEEISIERLARAPFAPYCANCERKEKRPREAD